MDKPTVKKLTELMGSSDFDKLFAGVVIRTEKGNFKKEKQSWRIIDGPGVMDVNAGDILEVVDIPAISLSDEALVEENLKLTEALDACQKANEEGAAFLATITAERDDLENQLKAYKNQGAGAKELTGAIEGIEGASVLEEQPDASEPDTTEQDPSDPEPSVEPAPDSNTEDLAKE